MKKVLYTADGKPVTVTRKKKRMAFSKKIFIGLALFVAIVVIVCAVLAFKFGDSASFISYIGAGVFVPFGVGIGFYFDKSRRENTEGGIVFEAMKQQNDEGE